MDRRSLQGHVRIMEQRFDSPRVALGMRPTDNTRLLQGLPVFLCP